LPAVGGRGGRSLEDHEQLLGANRICAARFVLDDPGHRAVQQFPVLPDRVLHLRDATSVLSERTQEQAPTGALGADPYRQCIEELVDGRDVEYAAEAFTASVQ